MKKFRIAVAGAAFLGLVALTAGGASASTGHGSYQIVPGTASYVTAGHDILNATSSYDDQVIKINLPFSVNLYGSGPRTWVWVSTNGNLQFGNTPSTAFVNECLPTSTLSGPIVAPYWDDWYFLPKAQSGDGIFTAVKGRAPHRQFVISWHGRAYPGDISAPLLRAEVIFYENSTTFDMRYTADGDGSSATIGVQGIPSTSEWTCNGNPFLVSNQENLRYTYLP